MIRSGKTANASVCGWGWITTIRPCDRALIWSTRFCGMLNSTTCMPPALLLAGKCTRRLFGPGEFHVDELKRSRRSAVKLCVVLVLKICVKSWRTLFSRPSSLVGLNDLGPYVHQYHSKLSAHGRLRNVILRVCCSALWSVRELEPDRSWILAHVRLIMYTIFQDIDMYISALLQNLERVFFRKSIINLADQRWPEHHDTHTNLQGCFDCSAVNQFGIECTAGRDKGQCVFQRYLWRT